MGCDIHGFVERKIGNKWVLTETLKHTPFEQRDYGFFAKLCGVRCRCEEDQCGCPKPRGWPEDTSEGSAWHSEWWGPDAHSHSWSSIEEINSAINFIYWGIEEEEGEIRILFFFDN